MQSFKRLAVRAGVAACVAGSVAGAQSGSLPVIPAPLQVVAGSGVVTLGAGAVVEFPRGDAAAKFDAEHLASLVKRTNGIEWKVREARGGGETKAAVMLERTDAVSAPEGYTLSAADGRVVIRASKDAGLYYGTVTLWQLVSGGSGSAVPAVEIHDEPQMKWRGLMLDSARHMQSLAYVHQLVETMSLEKMNTLHWHLTDDQGWRLEIKRYPKLTSVGAYRTLASEQGATDPKTGKPYPKYGGFYTQEQVRELVKFAAERGVTIVPEIEMPGHASAALAAYPEFGAAAKPLAAPASNYGIFPSLYNVDDATFTFLENVLTEVMALFPSTYIHVGGDEAIKPEWKASPAVQAKMKELGLKDEDALQSYFIKRIDTFITAHGHRTLGWDEILQGGLAPGAAVMSWHGVKGGIDAAKQGHDAVLTPVRPMYFNYRQTDAAHEAPGRSALNTLEQVYAFDPTPKELTAAERAHILGVQANLWSEYLITDDRVSWMLYPRSAALAEVGWSSVANRDWTSFQNRLPAEEARYKALGVVFDPNTVAVHAPVEGSVAKMFSQDLKLCVNDPAIAMEQDPPTGDRPVMLTNYRNPCWIQKAAPLDGVTGVQVQMVTLPWVFSEGEHKSPPLAPTKDAFGDLEIHLDSCTGAVLATVPLPKTGVNQTVMLNASIPPTKGAHDVCFKASRPEFNPLWTLNWEQLSK